MLQDLTLDNSGIIKMEKWHHHWGMLLRVRQIWRKYTIKCQNGKRPCRVAYGLPTLSLQTGKLRIQERNTFAWVTKANRVWFNSCNIYLLNVDSMPSRPYARWWNTVKNKADIGSDLTAFLVQRQRHRSKQGGKYYGGKNLKRLGRA